MGVPIEESVSDIEPQVWSKYRFNPQGKFSFEVGLRADLQRTFQWLSGTPGGYAPEPRLTLSYKPADAVALYEAKNRGYRIKIDLSCQHILCSIFIYQ